MLIQMNIMHFELIIREKSEYNDSYSIQSGVADIR